jgi:hypothetical protein
MTAHDPHAAERAALEAEIAAAERELDAGILALEQAATAGPLPKRTVKRFHAKQQELDRRITALQTQLEALPRTAAEPVGLPELHARLATTDLAGLIASAQADGDVAALRELLAACVESARRGAGTGGLHRPQYPRRRGANEEHMR